ncbi:hypothetical protein N0V83_008139 [Neocucurbitaria cava]|uniref:Uncharacterized protein n=1 Tax=Neocucurbitaria cava TaxID=798079 RepID=A0A9W8Y1Q1_9PLEO|nr:hypothetical protein N0V83_008139 [Neocucurbitaria cava]
MPLPLRFRKEEDVSYAAVEVEPNRSDTNVSDRQPTVAGWPATPQRISSSPIWIVGDLLLLLMPIAFIGKRVVTSELVHVLTALAALAGLAYKLDDKHISPYGEHINQLILLGPTLFPLAFAALGGRSLKKIALWKAERGTTLGALEHIIGSQSLVAAVGHAITLHSLNFLTLGLLVLWALSPLGGQSALRLLHETNTTVSEARPMFYANVDAGSDFPRESYNEDVDNRVNAVLSTSLMTADTLDFTGLDTWGHLKIPRIDALEQDEARNSSDRPWFDVVNQVNQTYASLTGVDVMNLEMGADASLTIPYEYMHFDCEMHPSTNATSNLGVMKYLNELQKAERLESGGAFTLNATWTTFLKRGFFIFGIADGITAQKLLYGSQFFSGSIYLFECSMSSVLVEAYIECTTATCEAKRLRRLNTPRQERYQNYLPYDVVRSAYTFKYLIANIPGIGGTTSISTPNPIDAYVYGVTPWSLESTGLAPRLNWTEYIGVPQKSVDMSRRLTKLLNTYWDASRWPMAITRNDPYMNSTSSLNTTSGEPVEELRMNKTDAVVTTQVSIYKADVPWVVSLVICSSILLILGLVSFVLSLSITAPDIFDYVSSFTRDNPYVNAPKGGSGLDGAERARLLRKLPVQLGDVEPTSDVGYIAMKSVESEKDCQQSRIRRERMYR